MTKKIKMKLKKLLTIIVLSLILYSCEKDDLIDNSYGIEISDRNLIDISEVDFKEFYSMASKTKSLSHLFSQDYDTQIKASRIIYFKDYNFSLIIDNAKLITQGANNFYVFQIVRDENSNKGNLIENLTIDFAGGSNNSALLTSYDLSLDEIYRLQNGLPVDLTGKTTSQFISIHTTEVFSKNEIVPNPDGTCDELIHTTGSLGFPVTQVIAGVPCPDGTQSSGDGGSSNGSGDYGMTPNGNSGVPGDAAGHQWGDNGGTGGGSQNNTPCTTDSNGNCAGTLTTPLLPRFFYNGNPEESLLINSLNSYLQPNLSEDQIDWVLENVENKMFTENALEALENGGDVDFENRIIKDPSFIGTQIDCVLNSLTQNDNNIWRRVSKAFTPNDSEYRIRFTTYNDPDDTANARTGLPGNDNIINIRFNLGNISSGSLEIATDILHETFHAELHRIHLTDNAPPNSLPQEQFDWFEQLWIFYSQSNNTDNGTASDSEHFFISQYLINPIAMGLQEFDSFSQPLNNYEFPAWSGLNDFGLSANYINHSELNKLANVLNDNNEPPCN